MLSGGAGKKKEIIIDSKAIKESTKEAKALLKKIAGEIIPAVIKQELKTEKYKGDTGLTGAPGVQGLTGPKGDKGDRGQKGDKGDIGPTGPKGEQGDKGDKGDTGLTGEQGPKGEQGIQGPKGGTGEQGAQGIQGPQGIPGLNGLNGQDGIDGKDGEHSPFCRFLSIKPIDSVIQGESLSEIFKATIENETLNAITVNIKITAEDNKKTAYLFLDRDYDFICRLGKYEPIGKPTENKGKSNNSKLLSRLNLEIKNNDIKLLASGLEEEAVNYYGVVTIIGGTFKD